MVSSCFKSVHVGTRRVHNALQLEYVVSQHFALTTVVVADTGFLLEQTGTLHKNIGLLIIYKRNTNKQIALISYEKYNIVIKECVLFAL